MVDINENASCVYCDWSGTIGNCLGGIDEPFACPECGCRVITEKEFNAQMDRVNGEEPAEQEATVIIDELYLITMQSKVTSLAKALSDLLGVISAHELVSLSCDRDGKEFCECLEDAVKKAQEVL